MIITLHATAETISKGEAVYDCHKLVAFAPITGRSEPGRFGFTIERAPSYEIPVIVPDGSRIDHIPGGATTYRGVEHPYGPRDVLALPDGWTVLSAWLVLAAARRGMGGFGMVAETGPERIVA